jgi:hypothetical protein
MASITAQQRLRKGVWSALGDYLASRESQSGIWRFLAALHRAFRRILLGLAIGSLFLVIAGWFQHKAIGEIGLAGLDHFGMAFFVAAIAVFGYEWQSHYKELFAKLGELKMIIKDVKEIVKGEARVSIEAGLKALFPDNAHELNQQIRESLKRIIKATDTSETGTEWNRDVYIALVAGGLRWLSDSSRISDELMKTTGLFTLRIPHPAELADFMLAAQMHSMVDGDEYKVISDFSSWAAPAGLTHFMKATEEAANRGVRVVRIFYPFAYDAAVGVDKAIKLLEDHRALASRLPGTYVVAITADTSLVATHEGIFFHADRVTKFRPLDRDLSRIEFSQLEREQVTAESFERVWHARSFDSSRDDSLDVQEFRRELERVWRHPKGHR